MGISDWSSDVCSSDLQDRMGGYEYAPESRLLARATRMPNALEGGNALCPVRRNMPSFSATRSATASMVRWPMLIAPLFGTLGMRSACALSTVLGLIMC